jgi:hypothetical protein
MTIEFSPITNPAITSRVTSHISHFELNITSCKIQFCLVVNVNLCNNRTFELQIHLLLIGWIMLALLHIVLCVFMYICLVGLTDLSLLSFYKQLQDC